MATAFFLSDMRLVPAVQRQFQPQHCMHMQQKILQLQRQQQQRISLSAVHLHSINTLTIPDQQKLRLCTLQQKPAINGNFAASSIAFQQQRLCPSGSIQQRFSSSNTLKAAAFQLHQQQHQCAATATAHASTSAALCNGFERRIRITTASAATMLCTSTATFFQHLRNLQRLHLQR
jgi:hypothetical protein